MACEHPGSYVVLITSNTLGKGDNNFGSGLMRSFLNSLWDNDSIPSSIFFLNSGVKLTCKGSNVLDTLNWLEKAGVTISSCKTSLTDYVLTSQLVVGSPKEMYEIVESMLSASKVITI
ncbi:MAG: sulfurtransferase-like selenium metabolism protein YedF [Dehalococcoidales bacterium]|nr:sulfurtransferase-like selenium metabolism protein YedF [Dehalococcoidales bacterium]